MRYFIVNLINSITLLNCVMPYKHYISMCYRLSHEACFHFQIQSLHNYKPHNMDLQITLLLSHFLGTLIALNTNTEKDT